MLLSSPPPRFADRELPSSGRRQRALRGREEIARLTARLRNEHNEYESASRSWSPEAGEKKRELRKARADTLVEIGAALTWLDEVELFREIERLPFEQKLGQLEAFLENTQGRAEAASREGDAPPEVIPQAVAQLEDRPEDMQGGSEAASREGDTPPNAIPPAVAQLEAFLEDAQGGSEAPSREVNTPPDAIPQTIAQLEAFLKDAQRGPEPPPREENTPSDRIPHPVAEPFIVYPEPEAIQEAPRAARDSTRLASLPPRSMRPVSRRPIGHWPVRLAPSALPRAATWRVPVLVGVIAVQGLALAVLALALLRNTPRSSESDPSRTATSNTTATAMATSLPPPATQPAGSGIPSGLLVAVPTGEPRPAADGKTPIRTTTPPRAPRSKPAAVPSPPALARRPGIFIPDTL